MLACYSDPKNPLGRYRLDEQGEPVAEPDLLKWAEMFENSGNRIMKQEHVGRSWVSTVFLALDHNFFEGPPVLWETMVFGGKMSDEQGRCSGSREQAEAMHREMVMHVTHAEGWFLVAVYKFYWNHVVPFLDDQFYDWR